jgi:hypothetical protein
VTLVGRTDEYKASEGEGVDEENDKEGIGIRLGRMSAMCSSMPVGKSLYNSFSLNMLRSLARSWLIWFLFKTFSL